MMVGLPKGTPHHQVLRPSVCMICANFPTNSVGVVPLYVGAVSPLVGVAIRAELVESNLVGPDSCCCYKKK